MNVLVCVSFALGFCVVFGFGLCGCVFCFFCGGVCGGVCVGVSVRFWWGGSLEEYFFFFLEKSLEKSLEESLQEFGGRGLWRMTYFLLSRETNREVSLAVVAVVLHKGSVEKLTYVCLC